MVFLLTNIKITNFKNIINNMKECRNYFKMNIYLQFMHHQSLTKITQPLIHFKMKTLFTIQIFIKILIIKIIIKIKIIIIIIQIIILIKTKIKI